MGRRGHAFELGGNAVRMTKKANKLKEYNISRGVERKEALKSGKIWIRPTMSMEMRSKYHRSSKREVRRMREEAGY